MSSFTPYISNVILADDINNWSQQITHNVELGAIGLGTQAQQDSMGMLLRNAHEFTTTCLRNYVDQHVDGLAGFINETLLERFHTHTALKEEVKNLRSMVEVQGELLKAYSTTTPARKSRHEGWKLSPETARGGARP